MPKNPHEKSSPDGSKQLEFDLPPSFADEARAYVEPLKDPLDEEELERRAVAAAHRRMVTRRVDLAHEAAATEAEARDLVDYALETGDPSIDPALEELKRTDLEIFEERRNLSPLEPPEAKP